MNGQTREKLGYAILGCILLLGVGYVGAQQLRHPAPIVFESQTEPARTLPKVDVPRPPEATRNLGGSEASPEPAKDGSRSVDSRVSVSTAATKSASGKTAKAPADPVSINDGTEADLMSLPGIGKTLAERLIEYRQAHNGFQSIEELKAVRGIGPKKFEKLVPYVKL